MARIGSAPLPTITDDRALGAADIQRSLRFNYHDNAYLSRTVSTTSSRTTFTYSCWVKRTDISVSLSGVVLMGSNATSGTDHTAIFFDDDDTIGSRARNNGDGSTKTTAKYRDPTAWMHVMYVVDTPQVGLQTVRQKVYVNGVEQDVTILGSPHLVNSQLEINLDGTVMEIGAVWYNGSNATNRGAFYLAEVNFVDGQALDPSNFGFTDPMTSIWMPKRYEGTYGTNGFYLDFSDNSSTTALGIDKSPNGNDFTVNNFSVTAGVGNDSIIDTPTNNFATLNPLSLTGSGGSFSNGNLDFTADSNYATRTGSFNLKTGKWYWEVIITNIGTDLHGIVQGTHPNGNFYPGYDTNGLVKGIGWFTGSDGLLYGAVPDGATNGATIGDGNTALPSYTTNDVLGFASDIENGTLAFYKNGSLEYTLTGIGSHDWYPAVCGYGAASTKTINFGQLKATSTTYADANGHGTFKYSVPSGFLAMCSANLSPSTPSILRPEKHFDTLLWTGTAASNTLTGLEFQPDFVWIKARSIAYNHTLMDSVRGSDKQLWSNLTGTEQTNTSFLTSFNSNGITLGDNSSGTGATNTNGHTYVGWAWKAGGNSNTFNIDGVGYATAAAAGLDGGAATPTGASVNTKAGFSILKYNGTAGESISHGLSKAPELTIEKELSNSTYWTVTTTAIDGSLDYLYLNTADQKANYTVDLPTSSLVDIGRNNECIMYMWHSVPGYSKIGSYYGNGSSDGVYVKLGFKPAWLLVKRVIGSGNGWTIVDNKRNPTNSMDKQLYPNLNYADSTYDGIDFLSNGFKMRQTNAWVNTTSRYLYMAFAETPESTPFDTFPNAR